MEGNGAQVISMSRTSSRVEARATIETPSVNQDENLRETQGQAELDRASSNSSGHEGQMGTMESQITFQQKRRRLLRQMQKDMGSTINSYTVVLVLVGSVTFIVFLQPPGGLGDDGRMNQKGQIVIWFVNTVFGAFYFSVAGIVVCISCVAFVLPRSTQYARQMLLAEMNLQVTGVDSNSVHQKMLNMEVKTNDKISRILKVAHIHQVLANLFFSLSLGASFEAFQASMVMVIDADTLRSLYMPYWYPINLTVQGLYLLYLLLLFLQVVKAIIDLLVDLLKLSKRLSSGLGVRLKSVRTSFRTSFNASFRTR